jgi:hypothetical protein
MGGSNDLNSIWSSLGSQFQQLHQPQLHLWMKVSFRLLNQQQRHALGGAKQQQLGRHEQHIVEAQPSPRRKLDPGTGPQGQFKLFQHLLEVGSSRHGDGRGEWICGEGQAGEEFAIDRVANAGHYGVGLNQRLGLGHDADSEDAAQSFRHDAARRSGLMPPT